MMKTLSPIDVKNIHYKFVLSSLSVGSVVGCFFLSSKTSLPVGLMTVCFSLEIQQGL